MSSDTTFNVPVVNLGRFQVDRMRKYGDLVALVNPETERYITYSQCADRIEQIASGLFDLGLRQRDVLCALTFNTIEYPLVWYAVNLIGGTFLTASPLYPDDELERRFSKCYVKFLLTIPELTTRISSMVHRMKLATVSLARPKLLNKLIVIGEDCDGFIPFRSLLTSGQLRYKPEEVHGSSSLL
ncbi:4CLL7-like protein [Mya arenaria]|uniref:4CLL7-like protein n=1 Tax=Mya arenaria TaxID=6604 RepID=A0ABY7GGE7_MYAAR|nr:4CLL7-like protein [Mya arenaria]